MDRRIITFKVLSDSCWFHNKEDQKVCDDRYEGKPCDETHCEIWKILPSAEPIIVAGAIMPDLNDSFADGSHDCKLTPEEANALISGMSAISPHCESPAGDAYGHGVEEIKVNKDEGKCGVVII
jgi:hypothetical protein